MLVKNSNPVVDFKQLKKYCFKMDTIWKVKFLTLCGHFM